MKALTLLLALLLMGTAQQKLDTASVASGNNPTFLHTKNFSRGELLTYTAHYGFINGGVGTVRMDEKVHSLNGKPCYKVDIEARTVGVVNALFNVKDSWGSVFDTTSLVPYRFYRDISEGKYKLQEQTIFDHYAAKAKVTQTFKEGTKEQEYKIPQFAKDMVSGYYYLRTINFEALKPGDVVKMDAFFENKSYDFAIRFIGKEELKTKFGKIDTFVMAPVMPDTEIFDGKDAIKFWVSDDENRVPVKVRAAMFVGAVEVELTDYQGLKTPIGTKKKK